MHSKRLIITGGSGFIGSQLVPVLTGQGYEVTVLSRNPEKTAIHFNHTVTTIKQLNILDGSVVFDVVINLAGQGITNKRWTQNIKKQLRDSRIINTQNLIGYLQVAEKNPIYLSAVQPLVTMVIRTIRLLMRKCPVAAIFPASFASIGSMKHDRQKTSG